MATETDKPKKAVLAEELATLNQLFLFWLQLSLLKLLQATGSEEKSETSSTSLDGRLVKVETVMGIRSKILWIVVGASASVLVSAAGMFMRSYFFGP